MKNSRNQQDKIHDQECQEQTQKQEYQEQMGTKAKLGITGKNVSAEASEGEK